MKNYIAPGSDYMMSDILKDPRIKNMMDINSFIEMPDGEMPASSPEKDRIVSLTRDAETNEDFEIIYQRELKLWKAPDGKAFREYLADSVNSMLSFEKALTPKDRIHTSKAQDLCTKFLEWLDEDSGGLQNPDPIPGGLFKILAVEKFEKHEQSMMETGIYLDSSKKWIGTVDELAAFIWALKEKKYFMGNNTQKIFQKEKDFFKVRYKFDKQLEQKTKPANKQKTKMKEFIIPEL